MRERSAVDFDSIVIGAGPAGSASAIGLARAGWRVALVDRGARGRPKCCGHCLHPRGLELLDAVLGSRRAGELLHQHGTRTAVGQVFRVRDEGTDLVAIQQFADGGVAVDRQALDPELADAARDAGVDVRHHVAASIHSHDERGAEVMLDGTLHRCRLVVGADGVGSGVARQAHLVAAPTGRKFGFSLDVTGASPNDESGIRMFVAPGGYLGLVRAGAGAESAWHLAACLAPRSGIPSRPLDATAWFIERSEALASALGRDWRLRVAHLVASGPMPWRTTARTAPAIALVGDAAGYVEPFTGEGISWALESAQVLAACAAIPGLWDGARREAYERGWCAALVRCHRRTALVASVVERPSILAAVGAVGRALPRLQRRVARALLPR